MATSVGDKIPRADYQGPYKDPAFERGSLSTKAKIGVAAGLAGVVGVGLGVGGVYYLEPSSPKAKVEAPAVRSVAPNVTTLPPVTLAPTTTTTEENWNGIGGPITFNDSVNELLLKNAQEINSANTRNEFTGYKNDFNNTDGAEKNAGNTVSTVPVPDRMTQEEAERIVNKDIATQYTESSERAEIFSKVLNSTGTFLVNEIKKGGGGSFAPDKLDTNVPEPEAMYRSGAIYYDTPKGTRVEVSAYVDASGNVLPDSITKIAIYEQVGPKASDTRSFVLEAEYPETDVTKYPVRVHDGRMNGKPGYTDAGVMIYDDSTLDRAKNSDTSTLLTLGDMLKSNFGVPLPGAVNNLNAEPATLPPTTTTTTYRSQPPGSGKMKINIPITTQQG